MDEYVKLPRAHKESYHTYMWESLFAHIDIQVCTSYGLPHPQYRVIHML